jgi:hypothetical protein
VISRYGCGIAILRYGRGIVTLVVRLQYSDIAVRLWYGDIGNKVVLCMYRVCSLYNVRVINKVCM